MENLKKVFDVLLEGANVTDKVIAAVKAGEKWGSLKHVAELLDEAFALVGVKWDQLDEELKASRADGHAALKAHVKAKLDLSDDKVEVIVEEVIGLLGTVDASISSILKIASAQK